MLLEINYGVPLAFMVTTLLSYAIARRQSYYAFCGSLITMYLVGTGFVLFAMSSDPALMQRLIAIIQIAAMLLNHQRRKARGVTNLWTKASAKLEPVKGGLFGIDIESLSEDSEPFHRDVEQFALDALTVRIQRQS